VSPSRLALTGKDVIVGNQFSVGTSNRQAVVILSIRADLIIWQKMAK
jgi:hypothetical protein